MPGPQPIPMLRRTGHDGRVIGVVSRAGGPPRPSAPNLQEARRRVRLAVVVGVGQGLAETLEAPLGTAVKRTAAEGVAAAVEASDEVAT